MQKYFPELDVLHTKVYQIDHCFQRNNKELFTDVCNGTKVCSSCNLNKKHNKLIDLAINDIVIKREGIAGFERMKEVAAKRGAFLEWKSIEWLERQRVILEEMIEEMR